MTLRRGPLLPLLLIAAGATFFAITAGLADAEVVHALAHQLWPLVLIVVGVALAISRRSTNSG